MLLLSTSQKKLGKIFVDLSFDYSTPRTHQTAGVPGSQARRNGNSKPSFPWKSRGPEPKSEY